MPHPAPPWADQPDDTELLRRIRSGADDAAAAADLLHRRHWHAARRFAGSLADPTSAEDLTAEAFTRVLAALKDDRGPERALRPYLLATIRNLHASEVRRSRRAVLVDDFAGREDETGTVSPDGVDEHLESEVLREAFLALPPRWQTVLWHTAVEDEDHRTVAGLLGILPNAVAALAHRAREGLRRSYLAAHVAAAPDSGCRTTREALPGHLRGRPGRRRATAVDTHLAGCVGCTAVVEELTALNRRLGGLLAPAVLGTSGSAPYLAPAGTTAPSPAAPSEASASDFAARPQARGARRTWPVVTAAAVLLCAAAVASITLLRPGPAAPHSSTAPLAPPEVSTSAAGPLPDVPRNQPTRTPTPGLPPEAAPEPPASQAPEVPVAVPVPTDRPTGPSHPPPTHAPSPTERPTLAPDPAPVPTAAPTAPALSRGYHADFGPHHHVEMQIGSAADDAVLELTVERLTSYVVHDAAPYRRLTCAADGLGKDVGVLTCTVGNGGALAGLDLTVDGPLRARATLVSSAGTRAGHPSLVFENR